VMARFLRAGVRSIPAVGAPGRCTPVPTLMCVPRRKAGADAGSTRLCETDYRGTARKTVPGDKASALVWRRWTGARARWGCARGPDTRRPHAGGVLLHVPLASTRINAVRSQNSIAPISAGSSMS
jgi:hypothetical protein